MTITDSDTICAIATPLGRSGVGIVRISGPDCLSVSTRILGFEPKPRQAHYATFHTVESEPLDKGIALYFQSPNSFTGEDVLELQGHGGIFILNSLLKAVLDCGCRLARPGEFSERAFINGKLDLAQAEAIADLINASTEKAARSAFRTLEGEFSRLVDNLVTEITELRAYLEASIDFTEEDIDFIEVGRIKERLSSALDRLNQVFRQARVGAILNEGVNIAIAGRPNAGKSSLLNALSGRDSAIVTEVPGTTRDTLSERVDIDGMPTHIVDTAGLRASDDIVEREGVRRARKAIEAADLVLLVIDSQTFQQGDDDLEKLFRETGLPESILDSDKLLIIYNKLDLLQSTGSIDASGLVSINEHPIPSVQVSARTGEGMDSLLARLQAMVGYSAGEEGSFIARERHMQALQAALDALTRATLQLDRGAGLELVAEDLRVTQNRLGEITGRVTSDDLLGQIFSSFCIGK